MSLGAGAWRVSGWPDATSREEVSMATLEAGTTPKAATNWHRHTEKRKFQWRYLPVRIPTWKTTQETTSHPAGREEREQESATLRQKGTIDPLWSASKATMQYNLSYCTSPQRGPATPQRAAPHVTYCNRWQPQANSLEFNFTSITFSHKHLDNASGYSSHDFAWKPMGRIPGCKENKFTVPACPSCKLELLHLKHTILDVIFSVPQLGNCSSNCSPEIWVSCNSSQIIALKNPYKFCTSIRPGKGRIH